jgi:IS605 OrfB family transposase
LKPYIITSAYTLVWLSRTRYLFYRIKQRRLRHAVNAMVKTIVDDAHELSVSKIVLGKLKGIRNNSNSNNHNGKANAIMNNFWSLEYIIRRFKERAEECGMEVEEKSEYGTSSECTSEDITTGGRLFRCLCCGLEAKRDAVGVLNIGSRQGENTNGVVACKHPLLLRWDGMRWEPRRAVKNQPMITPEARTSQLQRGECQWVDRFIRLVLKRKLFGKFLRPFYRLFLGVVRYKAKKSWNKMKVKTCILISLKMLFYPLPLILG